MSDEPQDLAEALSEDTVDSGDDFSGDEFGDDLPEFPPDRPMGVGTVGVTPVEEDAGESFAERTLREVPEDYLPEERSDVGQLIEPDASTLDDEAMQIADEADGTGLTAEEAAMHIEPER